MSKIKETFDEIFAFMDENPRAVDEAWEKSGRRTYGGPTSYDLLAPHGLLGSYPLVHSTFLFTEIQMSNQLEIGFEEASMAPCLIWCQDKAPPPLVPMQMQKEAGENPPPSFNAYACDRMCVRD